MEEIIAPIDRDLIKAELTPERFLRHTRKGGNDIYIVNCFNAPHTMREIGRLREIAFRYAGGGTGKEVDIDRYDLMDEPCQQLLVERLEGIVERHALRGVPGSHLGELRFWLLLICFISQKFIDEYMPSTLELGRSFVTLEYQSTRSGSKGLFALDNLWDGLGALTVEYPQIRYFFGKVTMYPTFSAEGRNMILYFLNKHFPDPDHLVWPRTPLETNMDYEKMSGLFRNDDFKEDYKVLNQYVRSLGFNIPPLVNAYMSLSPTMRMFGTAINDEFGDVDESGILIAVDEILEEKRSRHIETYDKSNIKII